MNVQDETTNPTGQDLVIRGGRVHSSTTSMIADVFVRGGKILEIAEPGVLPSEGLREINAKGLDVLPGLWHVHCHFRDPGFTDKEDFESGTRAAALGGVTFCIDQPNTKPLPINREAFRSKKEIVSKKAYVDFGLNAGGLIADNVAELMEEGALSVKIFNTRHVKDAYPYIPELNVTEHAQLQAIFEAAADVDALVSIHPDDADWARDVVDRKYIQRGMTSRADYEDAYEAGLIYGHGMVVGFATAAYYAERTGTRMYGLHQGLMPLDGLEAVRNAKRNRSTPLFAEFDISAAMMTRDQASRMGPRTMHTGSRRPTSLIWEALKDGTIDTLVAEHAPHTLKDLEIGWTNHFEVPLGITGAQESVPLILTAVSRGHLSLQDVVRLCAENPAKAFNVYPRKGAIIPGADADFTIVDMNARGVFRDEDAASKVGFSSWDGMAYEGRPEFTIVRGSVVMEKGSITGEAGFGEMVSPNAG